MSEGQPAIGSSGAKRRQPPANEQYDSLSLKLEKAKRFCDELRGLIGADELPMAMTQRFEANNDCCVECFELLLECTCCEECGQTEDDCGCKDRVTKGSVRKTKSSSTQMAVQFALLACEYLGDDATWADMSHVHAFFGVPTHKILTDLADARLCRDLKQHVDYALPVLSEILQPEEMMVLCGKLLWGAAHGKVHYDSPDVFFLPIANGPSAQRSFAYCAHHIASRRPETGSAQAHALQVLEEFNPFPPQRFNPFTAQREHRPSHSWCYHWETHANDRDANLVIHHLRLVPPAGTYVTLTSTRHKTAIDLVNSFDFAFLRAWWELPTKQHPSGSLTILDREALRTLESPYWPDGIAAGAIEQSDDCMRVSRHVYTGCSIQLTPQQLLVHDRHTRNYTRDETY